MTTIVEDAIKTLKEKSSSASSSDDALKYSQAALNLAHVNSVLSNIKKES